MNDDVASLRRPTPAPGFGDNSHEDLFEGRGGVSLIEHSLGIALNNKLLISGIVALSLVIGLVVTLLTTEQFRASARIEISQVDENVTNVQGVTLDSLSGNYLYLPTQYELLKSRDLANRVVRELNLGQDQQFLDAYRITLPANANAEESLAGVLLANLAISPVLDSSLVDIQFTSPSPQIAARLANAWADNYITANMDRRFGATVEARQFLEERLGQTRERLEDAEKQLIAYASNRGLLTVGGTTSGEGDSQTTVAQTLVASDLQALSAALTEATTLRISAEAAMAANNTSDTSNTSATVAALRETRAEKSAQLAELLSRFGEGYPPVQAARAQIRQIEQDIETEQGRTVANVQSAYQEALGRETRLRARFNELRDEFVTQRQDSVQYNILQREVDTNRELYSGLLQRFREIGVVGVGENNVNIVDRAQAPVVPFKPNMVINLLVSLVVGLIAAVAVLFILEQINQSLRDPREVQKRLGIPLLASIPRTPEKDIVQDIAQSYSELYEAYFSLTSTLAFGNGGVVPRSVMVTSSRPGEGKSLSSVALAYLLARQGKRVLLIDGDLRNSGMSKYITSDANQGVSQFLQGNDDWKSMIVNSDPLQGFDVLGSGRKLFSVAELLANGRFQQLLDVVEAEYDHVVVDGPPVIGLADAPLIASSLHGVLIVIEANQGKWRFVEAAIERLEQAHAKILGAVVTKLDDRNSSYGYGKGYGYGYGYGEGKQDRPPIGEEGIA